MALSRPKALALVLRTGNPKKKRGGSGTKLDGAVPSRGRAPKRDISRLGTLARRRNARSLRGSRGGSWPERFQTGHGRKASPLVRRRRPASFINSRLRPPMGGLEIFPPMNRRNPASGRMARCYGSRCGTRGSDYPLNRLFSSHPVTLQTLRRSRYLPVRADQAFQDRN